MNIERIDMRNGVNVRTETEQGSTVYRVYVHDRLVLQSRDPKPVFKQASGLKRREQMAVNLYGMTQELLAQLEAPGVDLETGEIDWKAYEERISQMQGDWNEKACNVAMYIKGLDAEAESITNAMNAMSDRVKAVNAHKERLSTYLLNIMKMMDKSPQNAFVKVGTRKSKSVHIVDSNLIPAEYMRQKPQPEPEPDKVKIKEAIESGTDYQWRVYRRKNQFEYQVMARISYGEWLDGRKDTEQLWVEYCKIYYGEWLPF